MSDVQRRLRETIEDLELSVNGAARLIKMNPGQFHHAMHTSVPTVKTLDRIADGLGVPIIVFFQDRDASASAVQAAKKILASGVKSID